MGRDDARFDFDALIGTWLVVVLQYSEFFADDLRGVSRSSNAGLVPPNVVIASSSAYCLLACTSSGGGASTCYCTLHRILVTHNQSPVHEARLGRPCGRWAVKFSSSTIDVTSGD